VRVLPGQQPFNVWAGWVTSDFHQHGMTFDPDGVLTVTVTLGDDSGKVQERLVNSKTVIPSVSLTLPRFFLNLIRIDVRDNDAFPTIFID